jgi:hypothetical protein
MYACYLLELLQFALTEEKMLEVKYANNILVIACRISKCKLLLTGTIQLKSTFFTCQFLLFFGFCGVAAE